MWVIPRTDNPATAISEVMYNRFEQYSANSDSPEKVYVLCKNLLVANGIGFNTQALKKEIAKEYDLEFMRSIYIPGDYHYFFEWDDVERNPFHKITLLSRVLRKFGLAIQAEEISGEALANSRSTFIAILKTNDPANAFNFVLVNSVNEDTVVFFDLQKGWQTILSKAFKKNWTHTVIYLSAIPLPKKTPEDLRNKKAGIILEISKIAVILFLFIVSLQYLSSKFISYLPAIFLFLKVTGLFACINLHSIEVKGLYTSKVLEKFCTAGSTFSCKKVLSSPGAKLYGSISMADTGLLYFSSSLAIFLTGLFTQALPAVLPLLFLFTVISLPYSFFSIYYQGFVIRNWCILCLTVQFLLWAEFFVLLQYGGFATYEFNSGYIALSSGIIILFVYLIKYRKQQFTLASNLQSSQKMNSFFQESITVLKARLQENAKIDLSDLPGDLYSGNPSSDNKMLVILDPHCPFCAEKYKAIRALDKSISDDCHIIIRLIAGEEYVPLLQPVLTLTLADQHNDALVLTDSWYAHKRKSSRKKSPGTDEHDFTYNQQLYAEWMKMESFTNLPATEAKMAYADHVMWHEKNISSVRPSLFINGHFWPPEFDFDYYIREHFDELWDQESN